MCTTNIVYSIIVGARRVVKKIEFPPSTINKTLVSCTSCDKVFIYIMTPKSTLNTRYYKIISHGFLVGNLLSCREQNEINGAINKSKLTHLLVQNSSKSTLGVEVPTF